MSRKKDKKSKKKAPEGYQPTGDSVSWEIAMSQAITALDHSAKLAIKNNSSDGLKEVARGWLAVADTISESAGGGGGMQEHDLDASHNNDEYPIGFRGSAPAEDHYDEEEFEDDTESHHTFPTSRIARSRGKGQDRQVMRGVRRSQ